MVTFYWHIHRILHDIQMKQQMHTLYTRRSIEWSDVGSSKTKVTNILAKNNFLHEHLVIYQNLSLSSFQLQLFFLILDHLDSLLQLTQHQMASFSYMLMENGDLFVIQGWAYKLWIHLVNKWAILLLWNTLKGLKHNLIAII